MPSWLKATKERLSQKPKVSVGSVVPTASQIKEPYSPAKYCAFCIDLDFQRLFYSAEKKDIILPNRLLTHLRASKSCPFCRLTLLAIEDHPAVQHQNEDHGVMGCSQKSDKNDIPITHNRAIQFWVLSDTADTSMILASVPHMFGIRAVGTNPRESLPRERELLAFDDPPKSDCLRGQIVEHSFDPKLPQWWLKKCEEEHGTPCAASQSSLNFGLKVIDVELGCIVNAPSNCNYAALSYVWGRAKQLLLCKDTIKRLTSPGSIRNGNKTYKSASGPQPTLTIRDAILLCRQLNIRYLWVDALCIQQDSEDRMIQIQNMGAIYLGASLTIVAASGSDANAGLCGVSDGTLRIPRQHRETLKDVPAVTILPSHEESVSQSLWKTRAWTFQEEILSHRCLIFTERQLFFRCSSADWCEDTMKEVTPSLPDTNSYTLAQYDLNSRGTVVVNELFPGAYSITMRIGFYNDYMKEYTSRDVTDPEDRLDAISGVLQTLSPQTDNYFLTHFGIPRVSFNYSLCWASKYHRPDRRILKFPSWSWAGWLAPVKYEMPFELEYLNAEGYDMVNPDSGQPFNATCFNVTGNTLSFVTYITKLRVSRQKSTFNPIDEISFNPQPPQPQDPMNAVYEVYSPRNELIGRIILFSAWREAQPDELFFITIGPDTQRSKSGAITRQHGVTILCIEVLNGLFYRVQVLRSIITGTPILGVTGGSSGTPIYHFSRKQWNAWTNPQRVNIVMG